MRAAWGWILIGLLAARAPGAASQAASELLASVDEDHPVQASLVAEHTRVPSRGTTRVGVWFELAPGWHIYAEEPGDAGLPTRVTWVMPEGLEPGPLTWPTPKDFLSPGEIRTRGYETALLLWSPVRVGEERSAEPLALAAEVTWLACKDICIPGRATVAGSLMVGGDEPLASPDAARFVEHGVIDGT